MPSTRGCMLQGRSNTYRNTAHDKTLPRVSPINPATAPNRTYSMAKARAIRPRVAPSAFRMTDS